MVSVPRDKGRPWEDDPNVDYNAFCKELYFFYGALMDLSTLVHVLKLRDWPQSYRPKSPGTAVCSGASTQHYWTVHLAPSSTAWLMRFKGNQRKSVCRFMRHPTARKAAQN